jgi:hypothetical protein
MDHMHDIFEGTWGFVTWKDVTSDIVEGRNAIFYAMPSQPMQGWAGNAQRMEVKSFRAGLVSSARDQSTKVFVEFIPRRARKSRVGVQRSSPNLVILEGWDHPDLPSGWVNDRRGVYKAKRPLFDVEWLSEMDAFLLAYLRKHPDVRILADFRNRTEAPISLVPTNTKQEIVPTISHSSDKAGSATQRDDFVSADETEINRPLVEGATNSILVNVYERNKEARRRCIEHYGTVCSVCDFDFGRTYGGVVRGYIHVHHLKALSEIGVEYAIDPIADLRPVCPNCHAVIHSRELQYTINEVRKMIATYRNGK